MPLVTQRLPPQAEEDLVGVVRAGTKDQPGEHDPANDSDDLSVWFAVYLAVLLLSMLVLGGIWISYFAL